MRICTAITLALSVGSAVVMSAAPAVAAERRPLPAFELLGPAGGTVASGALSQPGHWLLVYVKPGSEHSRAALRAIEAGKADGPAPERLLIVVGGSGEEMEQMRHASPGLTESAWYADPAGQAKGRLKIQGTPTIVGLRADRIEWTLQGTSTDPARLRSLLKSWLTP